MPDEVAKDELPKVMSTDMVSDYMGTPSFALRQANECLKPTLTVNQGWKDWQKRQTSV